MPRGLYVDKPQHVAVQEYQDAVLQGKQVRIRSEFAAIKHGTEFHLFSGESPFQNRRFDSELRLFVQKQEDEPAQLVQQRVGNMVVGRVAEVGGEVTRVRVGDRVWAYGPVCETVTKKEEDVESLIAPMSETDAVCLDPALFAYSAVRDAKVSLGDTVVVFGLGAIGLFVVQMLKLSGCLHIIGVDTLEKRRKLGETLGADLLLDPTQCDVGLEVRRHLGGKGADRAIEASGNYRALATALRSVQKCGRVVTLGYYKGRDTELELGAEWHHNRLELISSMPVWDNPLREYPLWDERRLWETLSQLFQKQWLVSHGIVDPIVPFEESAEAFVETYHHPEQAVKLGIRF